MPSDAELTFADHTGRFYARRYGFPPMLGRLIGYLSVCDPPDQSIGELAEALLAYRGTVIFTSHDRYFTKRVATCIVEVRDGRVTHYSGQYEAYVYKVNKEIEAGERELATQQSKVPAAVAKPAKAAPRPQRGERARLLNCTADG